MLASTIEEMKCRCEMLKTEVNEISSMGNEEAKKCVRDILKIKETLDTIAISLVSERAIILNRFKLVCKMAANPLQRLILLESEAKLFSKRYGFSYETVRAILINETLKAVSEYNYYIFEPR